MEFDSNEIEAADLLDALVDAIQKGDVVRRDALLQRHPHLHEWAECLTSLDSFAPRPVEPEFAPTLLKPMGGLDGSDRAEIGRANRTDGCPQDDSAETTPFGKYELLGEIGRGGMGVVYKARQKDLNRIVAIKMILASQWASAAEIARFQAEARAAARLRHRNIVGIFEVGEEFGRHFFAMDYVPGESLAAVIAKRSPSHEQAARWMVSIAQAVEHLHEQGLIHRDLKPSNILIDEEGEPMVTDFGLAKIFDSDSGATRTGTILGTPSYMSPEQAAGRNALVTARSDIYSTGSRVV